MTATEASFGAWIRIMTERFDVPVSYTHLDVYKRQAYARGFKDGAEHRSKRLRQKPGAK